MQYKVTKIVHSSFTTYVEADENAEYGDIEVSAQENDNWVNDPYRDTERFEVEKDE